MALASRVGAQSPHYRHGYFFTLAFTRVVLKVEAEQIYKTYNCSKEILEGAIQIMQEFIQDTRWYHGNLYRELWNIGLDIYKEDQEKKKILDYSDAFLDTLSSYYMSFFRLHHIVTYGLNDLDFVVLTLFHCGADEGPISAMIGIDRERLPDRVAILSEKLHMVSNIPSKYIEAHISDICRHAFEQRNSDPLCLRILEEFPQYESLLETV